MSLNEDVLRVKPKLGNELTGDQVKSPPVVWVRSHLTGQQVQLSWWSINLKTDIEVNASMNWEHLSKH